MEEKIKIPHRIQIKIESVYGSLKNAERRAADYIISHPESVAEQPLREISARAGSSMATFVRLAKKLGYQGYQELKQNCGEYNLSGKAVEEYGAIQSLDSCEMVVQKVFRAAMQALEDTCNLTVKGTAYKESTEKLRNAEKIVVLGSGDAYITAYSSYLKFSRIGMNVSCPADYDVQLLEVSKLKEKDVLLLISHSGNTKTLYHAACTAKERRAFIITVTNFPLSPLAKFADAVLLTAAFSKNPYNEIMVKRIPQLCVIETLYILLLQQKEREYEERLTAAENELKKNKL